MPRDHSRINQSYFFRLNTALKKYDFKTFSKKLVNKFLSKEDQSSCLPSWQSEMDSLLEGLMRKYLVAKKGACADIFHKDT